MTENDALTPREILLHDEGSRLLQTVLKGQQKEMQEPSKLVLADGSPATPVIPQAVVAKPKMTQEEAQVQARKIIELRRLKNVKAMREIVKDNPELEAVQSIIFACYRIIFWARMELSGDENVMDEMIADFERHIEESIYRDAQGYDFALAVKQMRHGALKLMDKFVKKYQDMGRSRRMQLQRISEALGEDGITLPGETLRERIGKPFKPGMLLVLSGKPEDTAPLIKLIAKTHRQDECVPETFSMTEDQAGDDNVHPPATWKNAAASLATLNEALDFTVNEKTMLVLFEDLETLYVLDERGLNSTERKSFALKRLYTWAIDNLVAVVVADNLEADAYDSRFYGLLPSVKVTSRETAAGREIVINGVPQPLEA